MKLRGIWGTQAVLAFALLGANVSASTFYVEVGIGASQMRQHGKFFSDTSLPGNSDVSLGGNFMVAENLFSATSTVQIHLGVKSHYLVGAEGTNVYVSHTLYPVIRFELPRFYFTAGVSPFVYKGNGESVGIPIERDSNDLAFLGEFGILWRVVPFFHVAIETSGHVVNNPENGLSPSPAVATTLQLRFYADTPDDAKSKTAGNRPYDGWRYPFGIFKD